MRRKKGVKKVEADPVRPKKRKGYPNRKQVKDTLREWEFADWENLTSDKIEGNNDARNDRE